jgi:hypothetical protein
MAVGGHFLRRFLPPPGNEAPAHRHQLAALRAKPDNVNGVRGRDVVVRLQISWCAEHAEKGVHLGLVREQATRVLMSVEAGFSPEAAKDRVAG